jgi:hypothetical protein
MGRDSSAGIATRYELDGPGIESRWGGIFQHVQTGLGAYPTSCTKGTESFPRVKRPGRGVDHPPPSSAEVKERAEPYLYSPSGPSWPVVGRTLPLYVIYKCGTGRISQNLGPLVGHTWLKHIEVLVT